MKRPHRRKLAQIPSKFGILFWNFIISLAGLSALLTLPIVTQRQLERYDAEIEDRIEPAKRQASRALNFIYDARNYAFSSYFLLDQTPHSPYATRRDYFEAKLKEWRTLVADDHNIRFCGDDALRRWREGTTNLGNWLDRYGRSYVEAGVALDTEEMEKSDALFREGIRYLQFAEHEADRLRSVIVGQIRLARSTQLVMTVPLAGICMLLVTMSLWNAGRLNYWCSREQDSAKRLEVAIRELHHRVKNNLQMINAVVEIAKKTLGDPGSTQLAHRIALHIRSMALVNNLLDYSRGIESVGSDQLLQELVGTRSNPTGFKVELEADHAPLSPRDATDLALIIHELLLYLGECGADGASIKLVKTGSIWRLTVHGAGAHQCDALQASASLELIETLVRHDLRGQADIRNGDGVTAEITFPGSLGRRGATTTA